MDSIKNSQTVQSLANGPVAEKARAEADNTKAEFGNLAASRQTPQTQTATGQKLTHYHSFFYNLLSWENPRATAISYVSVVLFIFATRYLPIAKYALKALYTVLGITATAEIAGKLVLGQGFSSKLRPKKYYTLPRETLESMVVDIAELINFFVIEFQRIIFAENVYATVGAFTATIVSYLLIKVMPNWGIALLFTTGVFFLPLLYLQNQVVIDQHLNNATNIVSEQASQVRDLAAQHTNNVVGLGSSAIKEYSAKAQEMIGQGKKSAVENDIVTPETAEKVAPTVNSDDLPSVPNGVPSEVPIDGPAVSREGEPLLAA